MEKNYKVKITSENHFVVEQDELKHLYTTLALLKFAYLRQPEYDEHLLLEHLEKDFKKFYVAMQLQAEKEPNNLIINKLLIFFSFHYKQLKEVRNGLSFLHCELDLESSR